MATETFMATSLYPNTFYIRHKLLHIFAPVSLFFLNNASLSNIKSDLNKTSFFTA